MRIAVLLTMLAALVVLASQVGATTDSSGPTSAEIIERGLG